MNYETTKIYPNEVVKADDFEFGFDAQIDNISRALQGILESRQDFVVNGFVAPYYQGGMNLSIDPIFGVCFSTGLSFVDTSKIEPISVTLADESETRIDLLEVRALEEEFNSQQRSFSDFETNVNELQYVSTKKRFKVETKVKQGIPGSVTAPDKDEGWVKLAEIVIPPGTTDILKENIKNITSDVAGLTNSEWTNEQTSTYNMGYISDVNKRFREQHNEDGTHKPNVIGESQLNTGTDVGQVNGKNIPIGSQIPLNGTQNPASNTISAMLTLLAAKITDLFNFYLKYGAFNFNGELVIGNIIDDNSIVSPLKIGADSDGTAYLKIGDKDILNITVTGQIRMADGYTATANTDLVTKAVTDTLSTNLTALTNRVNNIVATMDATVYANNVLSRFSFYSPNIDVATTQNIPTLSGLMTIDGVSLTSGTIILVKDQTNKVENGIYTVSENSWTRTINVSDSLKHKFFQIASGTTNSGKVFYTPLENFVIDEDEVLFSEAFLSRTAIANKLACRNSTGKIVSPVPTNNDELANKQYVDGKINDTTTSSSTTWSSDKIVSEIQNADTVYVGSEEPTSTITKLWVLA